MVDSDELLKEIKEYLEKSKEELIKNFNKEYETLTIDYEVLSLTSPKLSQYLISQPDSVLQLLEESLVESGLGKDINVRIKNLPKEQKVDISLLRTMHINKLVYFDCIVKNIGELNLKVTKAKFECSHCGTIMLVLQEDDNFRYPSRCLCGAKEHYDFNIVSKFVTDLVDIEVEEYPMTKRLGLHKKSINLRLFDDLAQKNLLPQQKIRVVGIVREKPVIYNKSKLTQSKYEIEVNNLMLFEKRYLDYEKDMLDFIKLNLLKIKETLQGNFNVTNEEVAEVFLTSLNDLSEKDNGPSKN